MSLQRNYYEVLGLPPGATTDQIKKKYRELARKFHPDVAQDKSLSQLTFTQINQAYNTLSNPERRAQYNGTLQNSSAPQSAGTHQSSSTQQNAKASAAPPPAATVKPAQAQNAVPPASRPAAPAPKAPSAPGQPAAGAQPQAFKEMLSRAENAIMAGKPVEARAFCVRILEADPRHVRALEILGDALVLMGRQEEAAVQYRQALQIAPSSLIQAKLNRAAPPGQSTRTLPPQAPTAQNGSGGQKTVQPGSGSAAEETEKPGGLFGRLLGRK